MNLESAIKSGIRPNFLITLLVSLIVLALINGFLPAEYKISRLLAGLFS